MNPVLDLPFAALVRRDLLRSMRSRYLSGAMFVLCGLGSVVLAAGWPEDVIHTTQLGLWSTAILALFATLCAASVCLLLPGLAGASVVEERDMDTLDLMRMTLIRPAGILAGKFVNCIGALLLLLVAAMPLAATTYFLVGVDWEVLLFLLFTVALSATTCVSIGLSCSTTQRTPLHAVLASYVWCAFALGGYVLIAYVALLPCYLFMDELAFQTFAPRVIMFAMATTPAALFMSSVGVFLVGAHIVYAVSIQLAFTVAALLVAWRRLCRPALHSALPAAASVRTFRGSRGLPVGFSSKPRPPIADLLNPVFVRELRHTRLLMGVSRWRLIVLYSVLGLTALLLCALLYVMLRDLFASEFNAIAATTLQLLFWVVTGLSPAIMATAFVREDDRNTKDLLRMTLLSSRQVALGKLGAGVFGLLRIGKFFLCAAWPMLFFFAMAPLALQQTVIAGIWIVLVTSTALAVSAIASMSAGRTAFAVPLAYGLCAAVFFGPAATLLALGELVRKLWGYANWEEIAFISSQFAYAVEILDRLSHGSSIDAHWPQVALLHCCLSVGMTLLALWFAGRYWMRYSKRQHL